MRAGRKAAVVLSILIVLLIAGYATFHDYIRAAAFVTRAAGLNGIAETVVAWQSQPIQERSVRIPWRGGLMSAHWYSPDRPTRPPTLLVPGVHASGIREPRLVGFARDLAAVGHPVLTPELTDLTHYEITTRSTDMIEDAVRWLSEQDSPAPTTRIGVMGISFAGGLSIVAAGRESIRDRVAFVMSFGGHGDLPRTLRYLCTGLEPEGGVRPPHDYGVAIILLGVADNLVPARQLQPLRATILTFLEASRLDMVDTARAAVEFARARELAKKLPEPSRTLAGYVNSRDVKRLGPILLPHIAELGGDPSLSPSRSPPPAAAVYLLHGADDNVIPAVESVLLARDLRDRGATVRQLSTPLITHAEIHQSPTVREMWQLVRFWGRLLRE